MDSEATSGAMSILPFASHFAPYQIRTKHLAMEHLSKLYRIQYQNGSQAYLQIDATQPSELEKANKWFIHRVPRTASYGPSVTELVACRVLDSCSADDLITLKIAQGYLSHETGKGKPAEWYTRHEVKIIETPSDANDPRMKLPGSILCEIQLDKEVVYFCALEGYESALYGPNLQNMANSKVLERAQVYSYEGTMNIVTEHGILNFWSPAQGTSLWEALHTIELQDI